MTLLAARGLRKEHGKGDGLVRAVRDIDLDVANGETVAVMGPSGCGKSTLLHLLGGLDRPSAGQIRLAGQRLDQLGERGLARMRRDAVGFVFQAFHLMDELTAVENVELPALLAGRSPRKARTKALGLLQRTGLADRARFLPSALSGGQRQRVAIARALANDPLIVLADEPTGNLDSAATLEVLRLFDDLHEAGQTLVIVTHDSRIAATADRLITMPALAGAIVGIPAGLLLYASVKHGTSMAYPPAWWLAAVVIATPLVVGVLTAIPARLAARESVAPVLQSEAA
jgi:ABC-type lipoprotein export system ATPase subunit